MNYKEQAIEYTRQGFSVFPCRPGAKEPLTKHGCLDASNSPKQIIEWWTKWPEANIGIATNTVLVLDVDNKEDKTGDDSLMQLTAQYGELPKTRMAETWSGGYHYYFKQPKEQVGCSASKIGKDLDIRGKGGYVIAPPSEVGGSSYQWEDENMEIAEAPEWLLKLIQTKPETKDAFVLPEKISGGQRNEYMFKYACKLRNSGLQEDEIRASLLTVNTTRLEKPLDDRELSKIISSACRYETKADSNDGIKWDYIGKSKALRSTFNNVMNFLEYDEELKDIFRLNLFTQDIEISRYVPWLDTPVGKMLSDSDAIKIKGYLRKKNFEPTLNLIHEALVCHASKHAFHPVREYLEGLKWDGVERLNTWIPDYLGSHDSAYVREAGAKTLIAACARVDKPGVKFDHMLILEGAQGIGKTSVVAALGGQWYRDIYIGTRDKDTIDAMRGGWIIEVSEMVCFRKQEIEALKAFISRQVDRVRLAYRRLAEDFPRQCVFIGTINPDDIGYLKDDSGNRRYWPVLVGKGAGFNLGGLLADRDQLWAEAYTRYRKGESLYMVNSEAVEGAKEAQSGREPTDGWHDAIEKWLTLHNHSGRVSSLEVWTDCLDGDTARFDLREQKRIAKVMRKLGWKSKAVKEDGKVLKKYVFEGSDE